MMNHRESLHFFNKTIYIRDTTSLIKWPSKTTITMTTKCSGRRGLCRGQWNRGHQLHRTILVALHLYLSLWKITHMCFFNSFLCVYFSRAMNVAQIDNQKDIDRKASATTNTTTATTTKGISRSTSSFILFFFLALQSISFNECPSKWKREGREFHVWRFA